MFLKLKEGSLLSSMASCGAFYVSLAVVYVVTSPPPFFKCLSYIQVTFFTHGL